jgi:glycosyltransferase involved in cell wall biosynthesis
LVDDEGVREELARKGRLRAAQYSWESCAEGLASLYHELASERVS